ncbi:hypothetical protein HDU99_001246, partial [Rhizoclosmatium hyalinum]
TVKFTDAAPAFNVTRADGSVLADAKPYDADEAIGFHVETAVGEYQMVLEPPSKSSIKEVCTFVGLKGRYTWRRTGPIIAASSSEWEIASEGIPFSLYFTPIHDIPPATTTKFSWKKVFGGNMSGKETVVAKMVMKVAAAKGQSEYFHLTTGFQDRGVSTELTPLEGWDSEEDCVLLATSALAAQMGVRFRQYRGIMEGKDAILVTVAEDHLLFNIEERNVGDAGGDFQNTIPESRSSDIALVGAVNNFKAPSGLCCL